MQNNQTDGVLKKLTQIAGSLQVTLHLLLIAAILWGLILVGKGVLRLFTSSDSARESILSSVSAVAEDSSLVTSVAALDMLWLRSKRQKAWWALPEFHPVSRESVEPPAFDLADAKNNVDAHCIHSYFIYFGYNKIPGADVVEQAAESRDLTGVLPKVIGIHPVQSFGTPDALLDECLGRNSLSGRPKLIRDVEATLTMDSVLDLHQKQGIQSLAQLLDGQSGACAKDEAASRGSSNGEKRPVCLKELLDPVFFPKIDSGFDALRERVRGELGNIDREAIASELRMDRTSLDEGLASENPGRFLKNSQAAAAVPPASATAEKLKLLEQSEEIDRHALQRARSADILVGNRAHLGAVQVTISTLYVATAEKKRVLWFDKTGSYLQRDVSRITVGSPVGSIDVPGGLPLLRSPEVRVLRPSVIAVDRFSTLNLRYGKAAAWKVDPPGGDENKNPGWISHITQRIEEATWATYSIIHDDAVRAAEAIVRRRLLSSDPDLTLPIVFVDAPEPGFERSTIIKRFVSEPDN